MGTESGRRVKGERTEEGKESERREKKALKLQRKGGSKSQK